MTASLHAATFEQTLSKLVSRAPAVAAAMMNAEAESAEAAVAANLPDPEVEGEYLAGSGEADKWNASLSWGLEWPGVYGARKAEAQAVAERNKAGWSALRQETVREAYGLLLDYVAAEKRCGVMRRMLTLTDSLSRYVDFSVEHGQMTALDQSKMRIERSRLKVQLGEAEQERSQALSALNTLTGGTDPTENAALLAELGGQFPSRPLDSFETYSRLVGESPELRATAAEVKVAESAGKVAGAEALPGISVGYVHSYEEATHFNGGRLGISVPLFSARGKQKAARMKREAAEYNYAVAKDILLATTDANWRQARLLETQIAEQEPVFASPVQYELLDKMLSIGRMTLLDYLQERNYYYEAELDFISLQERYHRLRIPLETLSPL